MATLTLQPTYVNQPTLVEVVFYLSPSDFYANLFMECDTAEQSRAGSFTINVFSADFSDKD